MNIHSGDLQVRPFHYVLLIFCRMRYCQHQKDFRWRKKAAWQHNYETDYYVYTWWQYVGMASLSHTYTKQKEGGVPLAFSYHRCLLSLSSYHHHTFFPQSAYREKDSSIWPPFSPHSNTSATQLLDFSLSSFTTWNRLADDSFPKLDFLAAFQSLHKPSLRANNYPPSL